MLLITGPTGNVGAELVDILGRGEAGPQWRIASRNPDALRDRRDSVAAEVTRLDFFDRSTWDAALAGVDTAFLLFPLPGNRAAREAIAPFVQRCSFFMQNLHRHISTHGEDIAEHGELFIPAGRGRTTFLDARDAAAVAALALLHPEEHRNVVHHLTGPAALSMTEVAAALTAELGYPVTYSNPSLIRFARRLRHRGVGWDSIGFMSAVYTLTRLRQNKPITDEVERLLCRPSGTLAEFLRDSAWRWRDGAWT